MNTTHSALRVHENAKRYSLAAMERILTELRSAVGQVEMAKCAIQLFQRSESTRGQLEKWYGYHRDCLRDGTARVEPISANLRDWLQAFEVNPGALGINVERATRADLLDWSRMQLQLESPLSSNSDSVATRMSACLGASLGLVFIRYSESLRESYYHWLLSDVVPDEHRLSIMQTLKVPEGAGTVGWIADQARATLNKPSDSSRFQQSHRFTRISGAARLWSCFIDPKGRVATEDLIVGNRSFLGAAIFDDSGRQIGVLFCFLPFDGAFVNWSAEHAANRKVYEGLETKFIEIVGQYRNELILSLNLEATHELFQVSRTETNTELLQYGQSGLGFSELREKYQDWMKTRLFPHSVAPGDPLGFQVVLQAAEEVVAGQKRLSFSAMMREEPFIRKLYHLLNLSCLFPSEWAPIQAHYLDALRELLHEGWETENGHAEQSDPFPVWLCRDKSLRTCSERLKQVCAGVDPKRLQSLLDNLEEKLQERLGAVVGRRLPQAAADSMELPELEARFEEQLFKRDPLRLLHSINLFSEDPRSRIIDLLVPLVQEPTDQAIQVSAERSDKAKQWCAGFLRLLVFREEGASLDDKHKNLYSLFVGDAGKRLIHRLTGLLFAFEQMFRQYRESKNLDFADLKTMVDLRHVIAAAAVEDLRDVLVGSSSPSSTQNRLELVAQAARLSQLRPPLEDESVNLYERIKGFVDRNDPDGLPRIMGELREEAKKLQLPEIVIVSLWLTRKRPVIDAIYTDEASVRRSFLSDRGLPQSLRLFLRYADHCGRDVEWFVRDVGTDSTTAMHFESPTDKTPLLAPPWFFKLINDRGQEVNHRVQRIVCTAPDKADKEGRCETRLELVPADQPEPADAATVKQMRIGWRWQRFPEPEEIAHVPGTTCESLFGFLNDAPGIELSESARKPGALADGHLHFLSKTQADRFLPESEADKYVFAASDLHNEAGIERLNKIAEFMADDSVPKWRFALVNVDDLATVTLTYADPSERDAHEPGTVSAGDEEAGVSTLVQLRNSAVRGVATELSLLLNTAANQVAAREKQRVRWLSHQLKNDFAAARIPLESLHDFREDLLGGSPSVSGRDDAEYLIEDLGTAVDQFENLQCLIECITRPMKPEQSMLNKTLREFLEKMWQWKCKPLEAEGLATVVFDYDGPPVKYPLEQSGHLYLILANLVNNAVSFAQTKKEQDAIIELSAAPDPIYADHVCVSITNTGAVMPEVYRKYVAQGGTVPKTDRGRTPEGLQTVRNYLQRNGWGPAWVETEWSGQTATRVRLRLPVEFVELAADD